MLEALLVGMIRYGVINQGLLWRSYLKDICAHTLAAKGKWDSLALLWALKPTLFDLVNFQGETPGQVAWRMHAYELNAPNFKLLQTRAMQHPLVRSMQEDGEDDVVVFRGELEKDVIGEEVAVAL